MADKVLYFPYIQVPESPWFTRTLLYWDEVGSIVPAEYIQEPEELGDYMQELVQAQLVKQIFPDRYVHDIPNFTPAFLHFVDSNPTIQNAAQQIGQKLKTTRIHIAKFGHELASELCRRNLAKRSQGSWYDVEVQTADLFMAYLASVLGNHQENNMTPISDRLESLCAFSLKQDLSPSHPSLIDELRGLLLENLFPAPSAQVPVNQLATFKESNYELLSHLRRKVEAAVLDISLINDAPTRQRRLSFLKDDFRQQIVELHSKMNERNWPRITFGSICGIAAGAIPGIDAVLTSDVTSALKAVPGLASAIYCAFSGSPRQKDILSSPLAYVALAQKKFNMTIDGNDV